MMIDSSTRVVAQLMRVVPYKYVRGSTCIETIESVVESKKQTNGLAEHRAPSAERRAPSTSHHHITHHHITHHHIAFHQNSDRIEIDSISSRNFQYEVITSSIMTAMI